MYKSLETKFNLLQRTGTKGWTILFLRGGGGVGQFLLGKNFFFAFGLCTNFF